MAGLEEQLEFPKQLLGQFMNDYQRYGKYNLEVQVPHLEKLARFYERRYTLTKHWTDCVKAHALYNSISARDPHSQVWKHRAFKEQKEYWADNCSINFEQQQTLTRSLKEQLESIRNQSRTDMLAADKLANCFDGAAITSEQNTHFFAHMRDISMECSEKMASFAGRIIKECVQMLRPTKPPCEFQAAAIGSIARGESTPYSDLEFFFLVAEKSKESVAYLERLAVTTYFQIANLEETKLSYMAINELKGWFDDKAKNGFKIDGLSDQAGNIPTGNGSPSQHNHFIVTPGELAQRYQHVLDNPDREKALRGDLTAMLSYIKPLYSHDTNKKDLITELRKTTGQLTINTIRQGINLEMMETDVKKFNFRPSEDLRLNGFAADVKREIYRFPSILLLDINIVTQTSATSSWESLQVLEKRDKISDQLHFVLALLLASATYMRMSAYLHHDSQDDRISVCQQAAASVKQQESTEKSNSQCRWFVPNGLFVTMCNKMVILKSTLAKSSDLLSILKLLVLDEDESWSRITSLFYTGRYYEALGLLKQAYVGNICDDPISLTQNVQSGQDKIEKYTIISDTLFLCKEYKPALVINKHLTDNNIVDRRGRIADCYRGLGEYDKALSILESITYRSASEHYSLGNVYFLLKKYDKAELSYLLALELRYTHISSEQLFDYYGNPIQNSFEQMGTHSLDLASLTPGVRLSRIINSSYNVIHVVGSLGQVYKRKGQYKVSKDYYEKTLNLISKLYGYEAVVPAVANTKNSLGNLSCHIGQFSEAEDYYKQALAVYRALSLGTDNIDIARTLNNLGYNYKAMGRYSEAEGCYKQALVVYRELSQGDDSRYIANTLTNLASNFRNAGEESKAIEPLRQALDMYIRVDPNNSNIREICHILIEKGDKSSKKGRCTQAEDYYKLALSGFKRLSSQGEDSRYLADTLNNLGINYNEMGQYKEADDYYKQALAVYRELSQGDDSSDIAKTLRNLGYNYQKAGYGSKAIETLREALDMYIKVDPDDSQVGGICRYLVEKGSLFDEVMTDRISAALPKLAHKLNTKGQKHYHRKEYTQAEKCYRQVLEVYRALSDISSIALTHSNLACIYMDMGDRSKADEMFSEAIDLYTDIETGDKQISIICHYLTLCTESV